MASNLQEQVLAFTQRLHSAEVERRDLRLQLAHLLDHQRGLAHRAGVAEHLQAEVTELQEQVGLLCQVTAVCLLVIFFASCERSGF